MIEVITAVRMGEVRSNPGRYMVDDSSPIREDPVLHRSRNDEDFKYWGWRYIPHWDGWPTNNIIRKVIIKFK